MESQEGEAKDQSLFVAGIKGLEGQGGDGSAGQIRDLPSSDYGMASKEVEGRKRNGANGMRCEPHLYFMAGNVARVAMTEFQSGDRRDQKSGAEILESQRDRIFSQFVSVVS